MIPVNPGLTFADFTQVAENGFGDGHNTYPHSMAWYKGRLYVGTSRANFCMLKVYSQMKVSVWPVDCPDDIYQLDRRAQIWQYTPATHQWQMVYRSPLVPSTDPQEDQPVARDTGYRGMAVFQGESDSEPALYIASWTPRKGPGPLILRTTDGLNFTPVSEYGIIGLDITSVRLLIPFKNRLFFAPTSARGGQANASNIPNIYESADPAQGQWRLINIPGFGDPHNSTIFELCPCGDYLYAGTHNDQGCQVWRSTCEGSPPYHWEKVLDKGGGRGGLNQITGSMKEFKGYLYVGTGIQNGGYDIKNNIGPAASELIRIAPDKSWDLIVGDARSTAQGYKWPLSGLSAGFGNVFNGYFWRMGVHEGWLYLGTFDSSVFLRWKPIETWPEKIQRIIKKVGVESIIGHQGGFDLWRTYDGENWLPVSRRGFDNPYNFGIRNLVSTPEGLFVGTTNAFGPRIAVKHGEAWVYEDNPRGGLEVWLGHK